ncbi:MAG: hypothetical protein DRZ76_02540 [Candidatus Nealsonbacteria bacterium]|nr:MAG: hypothetical protein DRZ76_02540 [Candidatus Nealsonbacteria bacterium]
MPVRTGYDNNKKKEPKCYAQWGKTGKKYYYTCNNEEARERAKGKAAAQGRAIIAGGWQEKSKINKKGGNHMPELKKDRDKKDSLEKRQQHIRESLNLLYPNYWLVCTFEDAIIASDEVGVKTYEILYSIDEEGNISFGEPREVTETYTKKRLFAESFNFSNVEKVKSTIKDIDALIDTWGSWAGGYTECVEALSDKPGIDNPEALCAWLHFQAEGKWPGEKRKENEGAELTGPIIKKTGKQRIVYAAVLVPGEPDLDADKGEKILSEKEIEEVAHKWMEEYGNIDYMHGLNNVAKPVETFILPMEWEVEAYGEKMTLPKGTWVLAAKVVNDKAWKEVEEGKLTGFSIMGIQNNVLKRIMDNVSKGERVNKELSTAMKRVLIRDLGEGWIVPFVSLIDEPCVPKAKFFAIKQKAKKELPEENNKGGAWDKIMSIFKKQEAEKLIENTVKLTREVEKAGRSISDDTYTKLKNALAALQAVIEKADKERKPDYLKNKKEKGDESEMEKEEVQKMIDEKLDEKLEPIKEGLKKLLPEKEEGKEDNSEKGKEEEEEDKAEKEKEEEAKKEKEDKEKEALKVENLTLKETLEKLEEAKKGLSKAEKGQEDGEAEKKVYTLKDHLKDLERDSQGRAIKKKK